MVKESIRNWNYRLVSKQYKDQRVIGIHEVYYTDGKATSCSEKPISIMGVTRKEIQSQIEMMLKDIKAPILKYENIG